MPEARELLGSPVKRAIDAVTVERIEKFIAENMRPPALVVLSVDDPAGQSYLRSLRNSAKKLGVEFGEHELKMGAGEKSVLSGIESISKDDKVDGVLIQTPLPKGLNLGSIGRVLDPGKDVDGATAYQAGLLFQGAKNALAPSTARAVMEILDFYNYGLRGVEVVIVGRSTIIGKPVGLLALAQHATITWCHTRTITMQTICKRAEVLIVAAGRPKMIDSSYVRPGATVIDVGINVEDGKLVGDVDAASIIGFAAAYTPVPGGIGPVTVSCLYANLLDAAEARMHRQS